MTEVPCAVCGLLFLPRRLGALPMHKVCRDTPLGWRLYYAATADTRRAASARSSAKRRSQRKLPPMACEVCGVEFPYRKSKRFCSARCRSAGRDARIPGRTRHTSEAAMRRRARKRGVAAEPYKRTEIAERDGYSCGLCGGAVDMSVEWPDRGSPSIDHVVPIVHGGDDTKANVQLAHLGCNLSKGARVEVSS